MPHAAPLRHAQQPAGIGRSDHPSGVFGPSGASFLALAFPAATATRSGTVSRPDVAADVSSLQNVEFINGDMKGGLYVYNTAASPQLFTYGNRFWCSGSTGVNSPLVGCVKRGLAPGTRLTDTQIGFDPGIGRWIASEMLVNNDYPNLPIGIPGVPLHCLWHSVHSGFGQHRCQRTLGDFERSPVHDRPDEPGTGPAALGMERNRQSR